MLGRARQHRVWGTLSDRSLLQVTTLSLPFPSSSHLAPQLLEGFQSAPVYYHATAVMQP